MAIAFKDFGRVVGSGGQQFSIFPASKHLADINGWIETNSIRVINCETLVSSEHGRFREAIRIWYLEN